MAEVRFLSVEEVVGPEKEMVGEGGRDNLHILAYDDQILMYGSRSNTSMTEAVAADTWDMMTAGVDAADAKGCGKDSTVG